MRFVTLVVIPILAGIGLATVLRWLPYPWDIVALAALLSGSITWAFFQIRWARRERQRIPDRAEIQRLAERAASNGERVQK